MLLQENYSLYKYSLNIIGYLFSLKRTVQLFKACSERDKQQPRQEF